MSVYTPLFQKIVFSSLWEEEDFVVKVFLTMLAKQDADHVVRCNAYELGKWSHKNEAVALDALAILAAPDTKRIEAQPFDGRRIEKVEDGWLILNGATYQKMMQDVNRRAYQRRWMADKRARIKAEESGWDETPEKIGETMAKQPEFKKEPRKAKVTHVGGHNSPELPGEPDKIGHTSPVPQTEPVIEHFSGESSPEIAEKSQTEPEIAQKPASPRVLDSTQPWAALVKVNAAKKAAGIPVAEGPIERPARRTVLDPGQPARPKVV